MLYSESKERQSRFLTALKIGSPFLGLILIYISVFAIFNIEDNNFVLLILFVLVYIYYIFYMIYKGFRESMMDNCSKAFNAENITKEIQKSLKAKDKTGFIAMLSIANAPYIEEQYGVATRNHILRMFVDKLHAYLFACGLKKVPIGRYQSASFLLIFSGIKSEKHINHLLNGFCKDIKADGIFKIEIKTNVAVVEKSYDQNVKNIISKLINISQNLENDLEDVLKPDEFDILVKNAVLSQNFIFAYHSVYRFSDTQSAPKNFTVNTKISIDHYGLISQSQISSSVKKNGYEIKFDQLLLKTLLGEIKLILNKYSDYRFIIKISAVSFRNRGFLIFLKELLKEFEIEPTAILFAISEKRAYDDIGRFKGIIDEYRELGFGVVFEQFGFNGVGIEYLKNSMKFDIISFDLDLIKNIEKKNYFEILRSLLLLLNSLGVKSLVKFIDKESIKEILEEIKPDFVQGFLFDKPKNIKEF